MSAFDADDFVVTSSGNADAGAASPPVPAAVSGDASPDSVPTPEQASSEDDLTTPVTSEPTEPERTPDGKYAKKGSIQERIDKATREKYDAIRERDAMAARIAALERAQQPQPTAPPSPQLPTYGEGGPQMDTFDTYEEYQDARSEWIADRKLQAYIAEQREAAAREQYAATLQAHTGRVQAFAAKTPDYFEVIGRAADLPLSAALQDVLVTSDRGPELAYFLATHQDEALQLVQETASLPATAAPLVRRLLESKIPSAAASSGPAQSAARPSVPAPIKPVGSAPVAVSDGPPPDDAPFEAHKAYYDGLERKGRR